MKTKLEKRILFEKCHVFPCKYKNLNNIPHWHREHELIFVESGSVIVMCDGNLFTLKEGMGAFLHSRAVHSISSEPNAVTFVAKADADYFDRLFGEVRLCSPLLSSDHDLAHAAETLLAEWKKKDEYSGILSDSMVTALLAHIFRKEATEDLPAVTGSSAERYRELLTRIARDYADITFEDAAQSMHFSRPYFSKYFLEHTGMSFTRYLNTVRISRAVELLGEERLSITEISRECGFNTIRNFNRVFRELTGYTPKHLPKDFRPDHAVRDERDSGFDPTLSSTVILEV